jgi:diacylglycerol kinase (ATP)
VKRAVDGSHRPPVAIERTRPGPDRVADDQVYFRGVEPGRSHIESSIDRSLAAQLERLPAGLRPKLPKDERVVIIDNPHASGGRYAMHGQRAQQLYALLGYDCRVVRTEGPGHARQLAEEAAEAGATLVITCSGDGGVRETAMGLMSVERPRRPKFSVIPKGTVNVFARTLNLAIGPIPDFFHACLKQIFWARTKPVDVARLNGEPFVCFAGFGFDAAVIENVPPNEKRLLREWAYVSSAFRTLFDWGFSQGGEAYEPKEIRVQATAADGRAVDERGYIVAAGNVQDYGPGWFPFHPLARVDDGLLDIVVVKTRDKRELVRIAGQVLRRSHLANPHVDYFQSRGPIRVESMEGPVPMHADCELVGRSLTNELTLEPSALTVVY